RPRPAAAVSKPPAALPASTIERAGPASLPAGAGCFPRQAASAAAKAGRPDVSLREACAGDGRRKPGPPCQQSIELEHSNLAAFLTYPQLPVVRARASSAHAFCGDCRARRSSGSQASVRNREDRTMPDTPKRRQVETAPSADRATAAAGNPGETGRGNGGVAAAAGEAGEKAREWTHEAKHRGRRMLDEQKHNVAEQIAGVAQVLHKSAGECLEREDQRTAGRVLEQAATALDRLSDTLRDRDLNAMLDQ